jgi:hypothetical protein
MSRDRTSVGETYDAGLARYVPPTHPCKICGRETLEHVRVLPTDPTARAVPDSRICSAPRCRYIHPIEG